MVKAREGAPALRCITAVADCLDARDADLAVEDRRYGTDKLGATALRTLTIVCGRGQAVVLNGDASRSTYDVVHVRLSSPLNRMYAAWRVPVHDGIPVRIVDALLAFCAAGSPGWSREEAEAGIDAAAEILGALGASRLAR